MNNRIPYLASIVEHHLNLANEALKRLGAAGSSPATGSRSREAVEEPGAHDKPTPQLARSRTEGRGEVERLVAAWRVKEAEYRVEAEECQDRGETNDCLRKTAQADVFQDFREQLEAALQTKPQTESEAEDVQRCPRCDGQDVSIAITGVCTCRNDSCRHFWDPSKRRERSGSGNSQEDPQA